MVLGAAQCPLKRISPPSHKAGSQDLALLPLPIPGPRAAHATAMLLTIAHLQALHLCVYPFPTLEEGFCRYLSWSQKLQKEESGPVEGLLPCSSPRK